MPNENIAEQQPAGITVVEMVPCFGQKSFGLGYAALHLAAALYRIGTDVYIASMDSESDGNEACDAAGLPRERFIRAASIGRAPLNLAPFLSQRLMRIQSSWPRIVHSHGMWTYVAYVAGAISRRWDCPLVLSPHGELEPYALSRSRGRKALASMLYFRRNLRTAACLCVLSEKELESARAFGFARKIEVIPNGVARAIPCSATEIGAFRSKHRIPPDSRILLFLSRIAPIKNLPLLLRAFASVRKEKPDWMLLIAGPDERGHLQEIQALVADLGLNEEIRFIGRVAGQEKACAYCAGALYVLPSFSEGLPITVLEAMEYARPVLTTDGWALPIENVEKYGWQAPMSESGFRSVLLGAMNHSDEQLADLGRTGHALVRKHFDWEAVAKRMSACYWSIIKSKTEVPV